MDEQKNMGAPGQPEEQEWRPPPPYIGLPVLIMVLMTAMTIFYVGSLLFSSENQVLGYTLIALTLTPILYGWWVLIRSRRRGPVLLTDLFPVALSVVGMPYLSGVLFEWYEGRSAEVFDVVMAASYVLLLLLFLFRYRLPPPLGERGRR